MPARVSRLKKDFLEIIDKTIPLNSNHPFARNEKVLASINILRQQANLPILSFPPKGVSTAAELVIYFSGDMTKNPPTTPTKDGSIDAKEGKFQNNSWVFESNTKLKFKYSQDPFSDTFAPVTLIVTGVADPAPSTVDLTVGGLEIFENLDLTRCVGETAGTFEFFVPAVCFRGGIVEWELKMKNSSKLTITKLSVQSATDVGDKDATIKALKQLMARLGAENVIIKQDWVDVVNIIKSYPQLSKHVAKAEELKTRFNTLNDQMKEAAINIKTFSDSYNNLFLGRLLAKDVSKEDKLKLIDTIQKTTEKYITQSNEFTETLKTYRTDMQTFLEAVTKTATDLDKEIQKQIEDVQGKITVATLELKKYQAQLVAAGVGLGAAIFAGAVGVWASLAFGGPLGPAIAVGVVVVALIGAAISIGFMVNAAIKINEKEKEIAELNGQLDDLLKKQEDIKKKCSLKSMKPAMPSKMSLVTRKDSLTCGVTLRINSHSFIKQSNNGMEICMICLNLWRIFYQNLLIH